MAIKGLTDHGAIFPQVGVIRKGAPKGERAPGRDLGNHFRFDPIDKGGSAGLVKLFDEAFPYSDGAPQRVRFYLPFPTVEQNWQTWREEWKATALVHRCDGEIIQDPPELRGQLCPYFEQRQEFEADEDEQGLAGVTPGCKQVGRLKMVIRELGELGYSTFITTSIYDLRDISGRLAMVEMLVNDHDLKLTRVPFILTRYKTELTYDDPRAKSTTGKTKRDVWLCSVMPDSFWQAGMLKLYAPDDSLSLPGATTPQHSLSDGRTVNVSTGEIPPEETVPESQAPAPQPAPKAEPAKAAPAQAAARISREENRARLETALTGLLEEGVELVGTLGLTDRDMWLFDGSTPGDDRALLDLVKRQANAITVGLENFAKAKKVDADLLPRKPDGKAPGDVQADYRRALGRALIAATQGVNTKEPRNEAADAEATATEQAAAAGQLYQAGSGQEVPAEAEQTSTDPDEIPF